MRARVFFACALAASVTAGCSVPDYELGYDDTGIDDDASFDDADGATVDSAPRDSAKPDTTNSDAADSSDDSGATDAHDSGVDAVDTSTIDATDTAGCGTGPACTTGLTCCSGTCVDTTTSLPNCGGCGNTCAIGGGTAKCEASTCKVASCNTGRGDCDGRADNGCEATLDTTTNCGACGSKCEMPNGIGTCGTGTCEIAGCFSGFDDCDKVVANGCEVDLTTDPLHCGSCAKACPTSGGTPTCVARVCKYSTCGAGFGDCDGSGRCLTPIHDDVANCGACGTTCTTANGTPKCTATTCGIASCASGFDDCNKVVADGCEKSLHTVTDCGACGVACTLPSAATTSCTTGTCKVATCNTGTGNCNGSDGDGCETNTTNSAANCGACGAACSLANATAGCSSSACVISSCNAGFANCDASTATGCERSMSADQNTCATATVLTATGGVTPLCDNGAGQATTTVSSFGRKFYKVSLKRCSACKASDPTRAKFVVKSPAGMAFDLRVYSDAACGTLLGSSTSGTLGGTETVTWSDVTCPTPKDFLIEVKWRSGDGCGSATLDVNAGYLPFP